MRLDQFVNEKIKTSFTSNQELPFQVGTLEYPTNTIITYYGAVESRAYFLREGIVQIETPAYRDKSTILNFFFPYCVFNGLTSFIKEIPGKTRITCITPCHLEYFERDEVYALYEESLIINQLGRILAEEAFIQKTEREISLLTKTSFELYQELLNTNPELLQKISGKNIAKYLGITPETLSRIRKSISS